MSKEIVVALAGNPNCGKTSLFNALTGARQHVGNWPGVTVEKKEGKMTFEGRKIKIVDLPGTYSLGAYSEDEIVARDFILNDKPDVIINVVDATNLERNLYLTTQILEMNSNVVVALNMMDEAENKSIKIDMNKLQSQLEIPVIATIATKKAGIDELLKSALNVADSNKEKPFIIDYGKELKPEISAIQNTVAACAADLPYPTYWTAIKLFENDQHILDFIKEKTYSNQIIEKLQQAVDRVNNKIGYEPEALIVDKKYDFIGTVTQKAVKRKIVETETYSDKIDKVVTNRFLGIPLFAIIMFLVYQITMKFGNDYLGDLVGNAFGALSEWSASVVPDNLFGRFITEGIIDGLGSIFPFVPLILVMYFLISLLEDSGYMARAAYVMDRFMTAIGLHGKTAISMIIGTGCNVAGIMATRSLESKKDRMIAILINPFMSCGARLPVYALFAGAFFGNKNIGPFSGAGIVVFSLYLIGIIVAIISGKLFSSTILKGESSYFVMELPPYRIPTAKSVLTHMWEKASAFVKKAGTVILAAVILIFILSNLPFGVEAGSEQSLLGQIGSVIAPIFKPAGFGTWQAGVSLITGILAKEAVVTTMGVIYAGGAEGAQLTTAIQQVFTPLSAYAFMIMTLLYTPCCAALGTIKRETNSRKMMWFCAIYTFAVGWIGAVLVYQIGTLLGFN
ncbi:ferrous iron transport protein B [Haloimpatiens sp. FM7330]|uniref:ferrous iron transport protein B n=1 Tax=Haloimpatiens sp. FM7330 TaxID=3298610 RepID=UPI003630E907